MALDSDHRHPPIAQNTQDFFSFNPFAEAQEDSGPSKSPVAVAHSYRAVSRDALFRRHVHSQTEAYSFRDTSGGHLHPLRSAGLANGSGDAGITRPHLSRIVKVGTLVDAPSIQSDNTSDASSLSVEEKDVLVHEVCRVLSCILSWHLKLPADRLQGLFSRCIAQVWYQHGRSTTSQSLMGV
jgi:hypothetical protein